MNSNLLTALRTIADLGVASFLLYRAIVLIRGTRSMHVVVGLMFLFFITQLVKRLDLTVTSWLLEQIWLAGVLLFVIVFQPEIRQALAELGKSPLVARILPTKQFKFVDEVIEAAALLKSKSIGALIILEQETGLRNLASTGVSIYGEVSRELLLAIFQPPSVLHDGAVIIGSDGKLIAARCIIPISEETSLAKGYGTRHQAALALAESSDAIVLVVSEQTGSISLARNGRLDPDVDLSTIAMELKALYQSRAKKSLLRRPGERELGR